MQYRFILIFLVALGLVACSSTSPNSSKPVASDSVATYRIGDNVILDKVRWKITEVKDEGNTLTPMDTHKNYGPLSAEGKFLRVSYEVENLGTEKLELFSFWLLDTQGQKFSSYFRDTAYVKKEYHCHINRLAPNTVKKCEKLYDIPTNTNVAELMADVNDLSILAKNRALINLQ